MAFIKIVNFATSKFIEKLNKICAAVTSSNSNLMKEKITSFEFQKASFYVCTMNLCT
jgi:hypothetical protein